MSLSNPACFSSSLLALINRAAVGGRSSSFTRGLFFLALSVTWPRPPLSQMLVATLNHATCNVYSPKAFETLIRENSTHIVIYIVCEIYFLLVLLKCLIRSKRMCQNMQGLRHW